MPCKVCHKKLLILVATTKNVFTPAEIPPQLYGEVDNLDGHTNWVIACKLALNTILFHETHL